MKVEIEGKPTLEFPDGTDPSIIDMVVQRDVFGKQPAPVAPIPAEAQGMAPDQAIMQAAQAPPPSPAVAMMQRARGTVPALVSQPSAVPGFADPQVKGFARGVIEGGAATATGIPATVLGLAGAAASLPANLVYSQNPMQDTKKVAEDISGALTYQPRSPEGQQAAQVMPWLIPGWQVVLAAQFGGTKGVDALAKRFNWGPEAKAGAELGVNILSFFAPKAVRMGRASVESWWTGLKPEEQARIIGEGELLKTNKEYREAWTQHDQGIPGSFERLNAMRDKIWGENWRLTDAEIIRRGGTPPIKPAPETVPRGTPKPSPVEPPAKPATPPEGGSTLNVGPAEHEAMQPLEPSIKAQEMAKRPEVGVPAEELRAGELRPGDTFARNGEQFKVENISPLGTVRVADGVKFDVRSGQKILADKGSVKLAPPVVEPITEVPTEQVPAPVPEKVPEPAKEIKEPWQMTREEIIARDKNIWGDQSTEAGQHAMLTAHRGHVKTALSEGKSIPENVLAEYPELKPKEVTTTSGQPFSPEDMLAGMEKRFRPESGQWDLNPAEREIIDTLANGLDRSSHQPLVNSEGVQLKATVSDIEQAAPWFRGEWGNKPDVARKLHEIAAGQGDALDFETWMPRLKQILIGHEATALTHVPTLELNPGDTVIKPRKSDGKIDKFTVKSNDGNTVTIKDNETETYPADFGDEMPVLDVRKAEPSKAAGAAYDLIQKMKEGPQQHGNVAEAGGEYLSGRQVGKPTGKAVPSGSREPARTVSENDHERRLREYREYQNLIGTSDIWDHPSFFGGAYTRDIVNKHGYGSGVVMMTGAKTDFVDSINIEANIQKISDKNIDAAIIFSKDFLSNDQIDTAKSRLDDMGIRIADIFDKKGSRRDAKIEGRDIYGVDYVSGPDRYGDPVPFEAPVPHIPWVIDKNYAEESFARTSKGITPSSMVREEQKPFTLTPSETLMKRTKPKAEQQGLDLGTPKGEELRKEGPVGVGLDINKTELGKAANAAADAEKQASFVMEKQELYTFPGPVGKSLRALEDKAGEFIKAASDLTGKMLPPWVKETIETGLGTSTGTTNRYPARKGIYRENIKRGENNNQLKNFLYAPDKTGYQGVEPIKRLSRAERKTFDKIRVQADREGGPLYTAKQLESLGANANVIQAYYAERMLFTRLSAVLAYQTEKIGMAPYESEPWFVELQMHVDDIKAGRTQQGEAIKGEPMEQARLKAYKEKQQDGSIPDPVKMALRHLNPFIEKSQYYLSLPDIHPNYFPRVRGDGEYHVRVFKPRDSWHGPGPDPKPVEMFMKPSRIYGNGYIGAAKMKGDILKNPAKFMPVNYKPGDKISVEIAETKQLPEDIYSDMGGSAASMALFDRAANLAIDKGDISLADKEALTDSALEVLAMRGAGRSFLHRHETLIEGYDTENLNKVMMSTTGGIIGWLNKAEYAIRAMQEIKGLTHRYDQRWAKQYFKDSMRNMDAFDRTVGNLRGLAVFNYLGGVGRSAVVNALDMYQRAIPVFSKYTRDPWAQLEIARKDIVTGNLTPWEEQVLERMHTKGEDAAKFMRDISGTNDMAPGAMSNVVDKSMYAFQWIETNLNRKPIILAGMRLFTGKKGTDVKGNKYAMNEAEAEQATTDFLDEAAGRYGRENRPEIVRRAGPLGSALYTFLSWSAEQGNTAWTAAAQGNARILWRMALAALLFGGIKALPGADTDDEIAAQFGVPRDKWHKIRIFIRDWSKENNIDTGTANTIEDFIMGGLPEVSGLSLSRSIGMNLPFLSGSGNLSEKVSGTLGSLAKKYFRAAGDVKEGDWKQAAEDAAPEGVANWIRAQRGYKEGVYTSRGYPMFDEKGEPFKYTGSEAVRRGLGFTSPREARLREADSEIRSLSSQFEDKKRVLVDKWRAGGEMQRKLLRFKIDTLNAEIGKSSVADFVEPVSESSLINAELKHGGTPAKVSISPRGVSVAPDMEEMKRRSARERFIGR